MTALLCGLDPDWVPRAPDMSVQCRADAGIVRGAGCQGSRSADKASGWATTRSGTRTDVSATRSASSARHGR